MAQRVQFRNSLFLVCLLTIIGCHAPVVNPATLLLSKSDKALHMHNGLVYYGEQPFTGSLYTLHDRSADTAELCSYSNGKEHGEWKRFYTSGKLREKRWFELGSKTGELISYWENGKQQMKYFFVQGEYEGTCSEWNREGKLIKQMNYKKGYEEGLQQCWYDNGKIKANYIIRNGRRYGLLGTKNCINVSDSIFKL